MMRSRSKKTTCRMPRLERCIWCEKDVDLNGHDYVCDGNKQVLHVDCFTDRLGIINANRQKHTGASTALQTSDN